MSASEFRFGPIVSSGPASRRIDACSVSAQSGTVIRLGRMLVAVRKQGAPVHPAESRSETRPTRRVLPLGESSPQRSGPTNPLANGMSRAGASVSGRTADREEASALIRHHGSTARRTGNSTERFVLLIGLSSASRELSAVSPLSLASAGAKRYRLGRGGQTSRARSSCLSTIGQLASLTTGVGRLDGRETYVQPTEWRVRGRWALCPMDGPEVPADS